MDTKFRLPALLIIAAPALIIVWYVLNTDTIGTALFGEKLDYCNVLGCAVTRDRFLPVATELGIMFLIGVILLIIHTRKGGDRAKD